MIRDEDEDEEFDYGEGELEGWDVTDPPPEPKTFEDHVATLRTGVPGPCADAVEALAKMGAEVLPELKALLDDENADLVVDVKRAIQWIEQSLE